jgi:hypothetical protein
LSIPKIKTKVSTSLKASIYLAITGGILLPILETYRRRHQILELQYFLHWFDDYLIGGFLLWAAWRAYNAHSHGQKYLCAAWGFATGMAFMSFFGQLEKINLPDPSQVATPIVVLIKGFLFSLCIVGLVLALKNPSVDE